MSEQNTATRLKEVMEERALRQSDLIAMCKPLCEKYGVKIGRSDLSQYLSGKYVPRRNKLHVLSLALGVNPGWLMGYDVDSKPRWMQDSDLTEKECDLIYNIRFLNEEGQDRVAEYVNMLNMAGHYKK